MTAPDSGLTGILLVGGASERFGSPKALARFRGETLAERGWRLLGEACDEVLAVGKAADLDLPFPVVDDGTAARAPVFGVLAGLRAARHERCVMLPVDCPLVTPELLRALGAETAVPPSGPLPGGYAKEMIPAVEERIARAELTLRGLGQIVLAVDEALLADVDTPADLVRLEDL
jgi:molybdopterin-guanine dinucleotide biosynthesis protein A